MSWASERAQLRAAVIDRSGAEPPAPALSGWGRFAAHCPPWSLKSTEDELACGQVLLGSLVHQWVQARPPPH